MEIESIRDVIEKEFEKYSAILSPTNRQNGYMAALQWCLDIINTSDGDGGEMNKKEKQLFEDLLELAKDGISYTPKYYRDKWELDEILNRIIHEFDALTNTDEAHAMLAEVQALGGAISDLDRFMPDESSIVGEKYKAIIDAYNKLSKHFSILYNR
jgi:hypothetical protein